jgi:hypothetical protein
MLSAFCLRQSGSFPSRRFSFALRAKRETQKTGNTMLPQAKLAEMRAIV